MSRFIVLTQPELVNGFLLSGVETYAVEHVDLAESKISGWLKETQPTLLAIDEEIYTNIRTSLRRRIDQTQNLFLMAIPKTIYQPSHEKWEQQIADRIRQAIGVHITFKE